jgi:hypothetical protein
VAGVACGVRILHSEVRSKLYNQLLEAAKDIKPRHIGIDTSAGVFGGNEIDRG